MRTRVTPSRPATSSNADQEPTTLERETLEQMAAWAVDEELARRTGIDEQLAESESRWAEEDAALEAKQAEARADADAFQEGMGRFAQAAVAASITDVRVATDAWEIVNGLADDPEFQRQHPGDELVEAAINEGVRLVVPSDGEDEIAAAERIMRGREARARMTAHRAGIPDRGREEMLLTAVAETVGATRGEIKEARRVLQLPGEP
jgi:hypothetical protein